MLEPRKLKHRKPHRPKVKGPATKGKSIAFGQFGLQATTGGWVKARQIEAARRVVTRYTNRGGKMWIRIFPHQVITAKGSQATMGSGKGVLDHYVATVRPGTMIFELDGVEEVQAKEAFELAGHKFSIKTKFVSK